MTTLPQKIASLELPLADYPGISRFARDLVEGRGAAGELCRRPDWSSLAPRPPRRSRAPIAEALARSNAGWNNDVREPLERWARGEAIGIVAGQQVGVGGGPLYTLAKIATLFSVVRRLEARGVAAVPFFWLATEDHDFDEVAALLFQRDDDSVWIRAKESPVHRCPVGRLPLPESLRAALAARLGETPEWLRPGISFADSFAQLTLAATGERPLVLVDSLLPELRSSGAPLLERIADRLEELEGLIDHRSEAIERAGYRPQVTRGPEGHYSLLYLLTETDERVPIFPRDGGFSIGGKDWSAKQLRGLLRESPQSISTGVMARPLLQDDVLEPEIFVGGPAEVAYYAQLAPLHARLDVQAPAVALRGHVLVAPAKRLRALERWDVRVSELFEPLETVLGRREAARLEEADAAVAGGRADLERVAERIATIAQGADPGLERAMARSRRRMLRHLETMARRAHRAVARRDRERWEALERLQTILYPDGAVQDRVAGWIGWWMLWTPDLLERLVDEVEADAPVVRIAAI